MKGLIQIRSGRKTSRLRVVGRAKLKRGRVVVVVRKPLDEHVVITFGGNTRAAPAQARSRH